MPKVEFLKGLPASGKSSYAKEKVLKYPNQWKRINKDDLRGMIDAAHWTKDNERQIKELQEMMLRYFLQQKKNVIIDDTNFYPKHEERFRKIAEEFNAKFEVKFFDVPVEECIKRDSMRANGVGAVVIRKMYNDYLAPKAHERTKYMQQDKNKPKIIVVDLDGTCFLISPDNPRSPFDMTRVIEDIPNPPVVDLIKTLYNSGEKIVFVSGRTDTNQCRDDSILSISKHIGIYFDDIDLIMRKEGDNRKDYIIKREIYENDLLPHYYIKYVVDDRDQVVREIRSMGLPVFQVAEGNF